MIKKMSNYLGQQVTIKGWVRTLRAQKNFTFIEINDGSSLSNLQVIADSSLPEYETLLTSLTTGSAVSIVGKIAQSPGAKQSIELHASKIEVISSCDPETYPLQKKRHTLEFLRTIAHLRPRTNTIGAVTRVRNSIAFATHRFFQERGFYYIQTPIITASDCEGGGELFGVTTLDFDTPPKDERGNLDWSKDFFGRRAYLTVSGQLNAEIYACALSDVYTFGPTFRAEYSTTPRHLAEFWMIEPEMAFADLNDTVNLAEDYLKFIFKALLSECAEDMAFFDQYIRKGVVDTLTQLVEVPFERITYTQAVDILLKSGRKFEFPVSWGIDFQSEHERYLTEEVFKKPVCVTNYPKDVKAFYMRLNDDGKTVASVDVLVPTVGEIIGGSQREERLDVLEERMDSLNMDKKPYWWYLELRKYGSVPHAGFGAGFERLILFSTGLENIRETIPFPRYPGHADF